jgi:hypothetical protein
MTTDHISIESRVNNRATGGINIRIGVAVVVGVQQTRVGSSFLWHEQRASCRRRQRQAKYKRHVCAGAHHG